MLFTLYAFQCSSGSTAERRNWVGQAYGQAHPGFEPSTFQLKDKLFYKYRSSAVKHLQLTPGVTCVGGDFTHLQFPQTMERSLFFRYCFCTHLVTLDFYFSCFWSRQK